MVDIEGPWEHHQAEVNGVRLHWVEAGAGPLVVLLHGFPEFWYEWRHQIPALAEAGFRVAAPDMRGYNLSAKPRGVHHYGVETLAADVAALVRHLGAEKASVVGHDWGGIVAWWMGMLHPGLVERLVVINAPHPVAMARELRKPSQLRKSWYAFFFQLPGLPEAALRAGKYRRVENVFRKHPVRPGAFTDEDVRRYKEAAARPGALTAMVNYYRAARSRKRPRTRPIQAPTLLIWGMQDRHLNPELTEGEWTERVPSLRVVRIPEASHWVPADVPERVNRLLADFLRGG